MLAAVAKFVVNPEDVIIYYQELNYQTENQLLVSAGRHTVVSKNTIMRI